MRDRLQGCSIPVGHTKRYRGRVGLIRRILLVVFLVVTPTVPAGCGALPSNDYPNRVLGISDRPLVLEDIERIVSDPNFTDDEKRRQLRELGIEDEKLIDVLLTL